MTKSAVFCGFGHTYLKKSLMENLIFWTVFYAVRLEIWQMNSTSMNIFRNSAQNAKIDRYLLDFHFTKKKFSFNDFSSKWTNPQETVCLFTFTTEIVDGKLIFCVQYSYKKIKAVLISHITKYLNNLNRGGTLSYRLKSCVLKSKSFIRTIIKYMYLKGQIFWLLIFVDWKNKIFRGDVFVLIQNFTKFGMCLFLWICRSWKDLRDFFITENDGNTRFTHVNLDSLCIYSFD